MTPSREDIIRIEALLLPETLTKGEGIYEWRYMDERYTADIVNIKNDIEKVMPGKSEIILDRVQNFRTVYLNVKTKEIMT